MVVEIELCVVLLGVWFFGCFIFFGFMFWICFISVLSIFFGLFFGMIGELRFLRVFFNWLFSLFFGKFVLLFVKRLLKCIVGELVLLVGVVRLLIIVLNGLLIMFDDFVNWVFRLFKVDRFMLLIVLCVLVRMLFFGSFSVWVIVFW